MTQTSVGEQRFADYQQALAQLETFFEPPTLNEREQQGLIKVFGYTFQLAWNILREAFRLGLIIDGENWMLMIQDRNLTSHTYNRSTANDIAAHISQRYLICFQQLRSRLHQRQHKETDRTR